MTLNQKTYETVVPPTILSTDAQRACALGDPVYIVECAEPLERDERMTLIRQIERHKKTIRRLKDKVARTDAQWAAIFVEKDSELVELRAFHVAVSKLVLPNG